MEMHNHPHSGRRGNGAFWAVGLCSLAWLLLRSGTNPRRLAYPCQRAALASSVGFLGYLASLLASVHFYRRFWRTRALPSLGFLALALLFTAVLAGSSVPATPVQAALALTGWTSPTAVSNVFVVTYVPAPECSLAGGALPGTPPCNEASYALADAGVDALVGAMELQGDYFYQTAEHPTGIVGADDVVVVKINNQWGGLGDGDGYGRLSTNTDVLKGLVWRILQHPEGFTGEVVIAENTQDSGAVWEVTPANAEDPRQSYRSLVSAFQGPGYPVSLSNWDDLNYNLVQGGMVGAEGYPAGEYIQGDTRDAYILLEDPAGSGTDELSYPKFRTAGGNFVSMRYGVWDGSRYDAERLTFINLPVLKKHGMAAATIAWKNLIGFVTIFDNERRFGDWDAMHDFFWGYTGGAGRDYGLLGREMALVRAPDLNVVDAIWVAVDDNTSGNAVRENALLASRDPFAVDWYASEYLLRPSVSWGAEDSSAARAGVFRAATRTNQNAAAAVWPGGNYAYMDLLDDYDGDAPSEAEKNQMNVYVNGEGAAVQPAEAPAPAGEAEVEAPATPARVVGLIDGFEAAGGEWTTDSDGMGSAVDCSVESGIAHEGTSALRIQYQVVPGGWADCGQYFESAQDWGAESPGLSVWLRSEQPDGSIILMLFSGDPLAPTPFEAEFGVTAAGVDNWAPYAFAWDDFVRAQWADESGLAEPDATRVTGYGLSFWADENAKENTLWVDEVAPAGAEAFAQPAEPAAPIEAPPGEAPAPSASATPAEAAGGGGLCPAAALLPLGAVALVFARRRKMRE